MGRNYYDFMLPAALLSECILGNGGPEAEIAKAGEFNFSVTPRTHEDIFLLLISFKERTNWGSDIYHHPPG